MISQEPAALLSNRRPYIPGSEPFGAWISHHSTRCLCFLEAPAVVTNRFPLALIPDLYPAFIFVFASRQPGKDFFWSLRVDPERGQHYENPEKEGRHECAEDPLRSLVWNGPPYSGRSLFVITCAVIWYLRRTVKRREPIEQSLLCTELTSLVIRGPRERSEIPPNRFLFPLIQHRNFQFHWITTGCSPGELRHVLSMLVLEQWYPEYDAPPSGGRVHATKLGSPACCWKNFRHVSCVQVTRKMLPWERECLWHRKRQASVGSGLRGPPFENRVFPFPRPHDWGRYVGSGSGYEFQKTHDASW